MKKLALVVLIALFTLIGWHYQIKKSKNEYIQRFEEFFSNSLYKASIVLDEDSDSKGKMVLIRQIPNRRLKNEVDIKINLDYGPLILDPLSIAKVKLEGNSDILNFFTQESKEEFKKYLKKNSKVIISSKLLFNNKIKSQVVITPLFLEDQNGILKSQNIEIKSSFDKNLIGDSRLFSKNISLELKKDNIKIALNSALFKVNVLKREKNLIFFKNLLEVDEVDIFKKDYIKNAKLKLSFKNSLIEDDKNSSRVHYTISLDTKALDNYTKTLFKDIKEEELKVEILSLGKEGLIKFLDLLEKEEELNQKIQKALLLKDDYKLQSAIFYKEEMINQELPKVINKLIIPKLTTLNFKLKFLREHQNKINIKMQYDGEPLEGDWLNAIIAVGAKGFKNISANVDIAIEKSFILEFEPAVGIIIEAMKNKGYVKENNGLYLFRAKLKDGKVFIDNKAMPIEQFILSIIL